MPEDGDSETVSTALTSGDLAIFDRVVESESEADESEADDLEELELELEVRLVLRSFFLLRVEPPELDSLALDAAITAHEHMDISRVVSSTHVQNLILV